MAGLLAIRRLRQLFFGARTEKTKAVVERNAAAPDAPNTRAALAGAQIVGLAMARKIACIEPIASAEPAWLAATIGPVVQHYLTAPLSNAPPPDA